MISNINNHATITAVDHLKSLIEEGYYKEKEKLPTDYELAKDFGVTRQEIKEAIDLLEEENILVRRPGVGVFVHTKPILSSGIEQLGSVTEMIERSGKKPGAQYISAEITKPTDDDRKRFSPLKIDDFAQLERVRTADGEPVVYCIDKFDQRLLPLDIIHTQSSIFNALKTYANKHIDYGVAYIEPIGYHEKISPILNCEPDQALLLLKQMHYTKDNEPVLYSANFFRADVFSFYVLRKRL
ncbi:GntR family transcriptional regulator [Gracilibacillus sp. YIM 98692]|uniref:GntR family transcriptional regulator n=1 Tax=Gracilibacillus sp. YIM 98692 TaxID=2663532 RepID=UPI0013D65A74|nr:GntR family transcriptional regulator [Gracilibacillus sp. YIM 98692]